MNAIPYADLNQRRKANREYARRKRAKARKATDDALVGSDAGPLMPLAMRVRTVDNTFDVLELAYTACASGDVIRARTLIQLASVAARIVQSAELERRLADVEVAIASREGVT